MLLKKITNIKIVTTNCNTMTMSFLLIITTTSSHTKGSRRPKIRAKNTIYYIKTQCKLVKITFDIKDSTQNLELS